ncbi:hypothetical protein Tco_1193000 [Tanacetum coccineum]
MDRRPHLIHQPTNGSRRESIVKTWIILPFLQRFEKVSAPNPASAKAAWDTIETIFQENKRTRTVALKGELRVSYKWATTHQKTLQSPEIDFHYPHFITDLGLPSPGNLKLGNMDTGAFISP